MTAAFEWLSEAKLPASHVLELIHSLAHAAGPLGMVDGQARDIQGEGQQLSLEQLQVLHAGKTGALIHYAFKAGAILAGATSTQQKLLEKLGRTYGLAFQIYDDILDVTSTAQQLGKAVHKDKGEQKNTYPGLLGLAGARRELSKTLSQARAIIGNLGEIGVKTELYQELLEYFKA